MKIGKSPLLDNPDKIHKPFQEWPTPETLETASPVNYAGPQGTAQWLDRNIWNSTTNSAKNLRREKADPLLEILAKSHAKTLIWSSSTMHCVLSPSDYVVSMIAQLRNKPKHQNLSQNTEEITFPKQELKVPQG